MVRRRRQPRSNRPAGLSRRRSHGGSVRRLLGVLRGPPVPDGRCARLRRRDPAEAARRLRSRRRLLALLRRCHRGALDLHRQLVLVDRPVRSAPASSGQNEGGSEAEFDFLERVGKAASDDGKLVFVVMHMPTQDPGDHTYREPTAVLHTMGKTAGGVLDNSLFEQTAVAAGVDGVFVGHVKGQFLHTGDGGIPYLVDGGAGGELYTTGPIGTDHGYWHGYRLIRVQGDSFVTDSVPIFVDGEITIAGAKEVAPGERRTFEAFGQQPVFNDPAMVPALELCDPDPVPRSGRTGIAAWLVRAAPWLAPLAILFLLIALARVAAMPLRHRRVAVPALVTALGALGFAGVSAAQQSEPTSTPVESLPNPAPMWTSSKPQVLRPVASDTVDERRNARKQTADGTFRGVCPGRSRLTIAPGSSTPACGSPSRARTARSSTRSAAAGRDPSGPARARGAGRARPEGPDCCACDQRWRQGGDAEALLLAARRGRGQVGRDDGRQGQARRGRGRPLPRPGHGAIGSQAGQAQLLDSRPRLRTRATLGPCACSARRRRPWRSGARPGSARGSRAIRARG